MERDEGHHEVRDEEGCEKAGQAEAPVWRDEEPQPAQTEPPPEPPVPYAEPVPEAPAGEEPPPEEPPLPTLPRRRRWRRWIARTLLTVLALVAAFALYELATWPDVAALARQNPESTAFIERYERRARARGEAGRVTQRWAPYGAISDHLKQAVVVAEDINFFSHRGFDWHEVETALAESWHQGKPLRGASTLSQQLAKNLWLAPSRGPWRKVKEALLTRQLERHLSKRRILELYLNVVELGPGIYGAEAAARHYFGKSAATLTPREAAALAASLPKPSSWHPGSTSRAYQRRTERILGRMRQAVWVRELL